MTYLSIKKTILSTKRQHYQYKDNIINKNTL